MKILSVAWHVRGARSLTGTLLNNIIEDSGTIGNQKKVIHIADVYKIRCFEKLSFQNATRSVLQIGLIEMISTKASIFCFLIMISFLRFDWES